ncbi:MAG: hypothetical protein AB1500_03225 [Bacillota bacterium]
MERLREYVGKKLSVERVKDSDALLTNGIVCRYLPDPPEDFDEFEFTFDFEDETVVLLVTVELGNIKRLYFSLADHDDPDVTRPLTDDQLKRLLSSKGDRLVRFLDHITL